MVAVSTFCVSARTTPSLNGPLCAGPALSSRARAGDSAGSPARPRSRTGSRRRVRGGALMRRLRAPPPPAAPPARARPPRAPPRRARPSRARAEAPCPGRLSARAPAVSGWRSRQANSSNAKPIAASEPSAPTGRRSPRGARAARPAAPAAPSSSGATRCVPQRSCSFAAVAGLDAALVAGHGLVLGTVVAHELAAAQRDERRHDADQRRAELAAQAAAPASRRRPAPRTRTAAVATLPCSNESRASGRRRRTTGSATNISDMRTTPRASGTPIRRAEARPWAAGHLDPAVGRPHGRRPRGRAEQRQPVAQRHTAETELFVAHASHRSNPVDAVHERAHCEFEVAHVDALVGRVNRVEQLRGRIPQGKETVGDRAVGLPQEVRVREARADLRHEQRAGLELRRPTRRGHRAAACRRWSASRRAGVSASSRSTSSPASAARNSPAAPRLPCPEARGSRIRSYAPGGDHVALARRARHRRRDRRARHGGQQLPELRVLRAASLDALVQGPAARREHVEQRLELGLRRGAPACRPQGARARARA